MFTPQKLNEIEFARARFGGYDMASVDDILTPLVQDYTTIYNENENLKAKLRGLVKKLEEYRTNEGKTRNATAQTQKNCDKMMQDTEHKCAQMLAQAKAEADAIKAEAEAMKAEAAMAMEARSAAPTNESALVEAVQKAAAARIAEIHVH